MEGQRSLRQQAKFSQRILCSSGRIPPSINFISNSDYTQSQNTWQGLK